MNKRQRDILAALQPATDTALAVKRAPSAKPGLVLNKRISAEASAELFIYGDIGEGGWFSDAIGAADVQAVLQQAGPGPIDVRLNSGGGDVFQGVAIHTLLARHPGTVTVYVDGLAASAASFIMLAGDRIVSARNAFIMIHKAATMTYGDDQDHTRAADLLGKVSLSIADMYSERAGEDPAYWLELMNSNGLDGKWYTGQEALAAGLVDELTVTPDDVVEDRAVAARLLAHLDRLPPQAREFVSDHPVETDDGEETSGDAAPDAGVPEEDAPDEQTTEVDDFAFAMSMWQFTQAARPVEENA